MTRWSILPVLAVTALVALVSAAGLLVTGRDAPVLATHLAFAIGVMPLILAAMAYFIPVLTRGRQAGVAGWLPPLLALAGGLVAVWAFAGDYSAMKTATGAALAGIGASVFATWALRSRSVMLGRPHPGLAWYLAALAMLVAALLAVMMMPIFPQWRQELRTFHLHVNLLGFIGMTALGTVQVLLPTCVGRPDPRAAQRLQRDLWPLIVAVALIAVAGMVATATGSAAARYMSIAGGGLYALVVLRIVADWLRLFRAEILSPHGAAASLFAAIAGFAGLLLLGGLHALQQGSGRAAVPGFVVAFLLPLVSGAVAQLLPVWLRPGPQDAWHAALRFRLGRWGGVRGLLLAAAGLLLSLA